MINFVRGNIFDSGCQLLCNTVNCCGVMGAGLAKQFKDRYPDMFNSYRSECRRRMVTPGSVWIHFADDRSDLRIANLAVKDHWRDSSKLLWVEQCLSNLRDAIVSSNIRSVAIPPLGCGLGGLDWGTVKPMIVQTFEGLPDVDVEIYEPM